MTSDIHRPMSPEELIDKHRKDAEAYVNSAETADRLSDAVLLYERAVMLYDTLSKMCHRRNDWYSANEFNIRYCDVLARLIQLNEKNQLLPYNKLQTLKSAHDQQKINIIHELFSRAMQYKTEQGDCKLFSTVIEEAASLYLPPDPDTHFLIGKCHWYLEESNLSTTINQAESIFKSLLATLPLEDQLRSAVLYFIYSDAQTQYRVAEDALKSYAFKIATHMLQEVLKRLKKYDKFWQNKELNLYFTVQLKLAEAMLGQNQFKDALHQQLSTHCDILKIYPEQTLINDSNTLKNKIIVRACQLKLDAAFRELSKRELLLIPPLLTEAEHWLQRADNFYSDECQDEKLRLIRLRIKLFDAQHDFKSAINQHATEIRHLTDQEKTRPLYQATRIKAIVDLAKRCLRYAETYEKLGDQCVASNDHTAATKHYQQGIQCLQLNRSTANEIMLRLHVSLYQKLAISCFLQKQYKRAYMAITGAIMKATQFVHRFITGSKIEFLLIFSKLHLKAAEILIQSKEDPDKLNHHYDQAYEHLHWLNISAIDDIATLYFLNKILNLNTEFSNSAVKHTCTFKTIDTILGHVSCPGIFAQEAAQLEKLKAVFLKETPAANAYLKLLRQQNALTAKQSVLCNKLFSLLDPCETQTTLTATAS